MRNGHTYWRISMRRSSVIMFVIYAVLIAACGLRIWFTLEKGKHFEQQKVTTTGASPAITSLSPGSGTGSSLVGIRENLREPLTLLLLQLIVIVLLARLFAALFVRFHQPAVIGEM